MARWVLKCLECGEEWLLEVSYDISEMDRIYHYCSKCGKNTFHKILRMEPL